MITRYYNRIIQSFAVMKHVCCCHFRRFRGTITGCICFFIILFLLHIYIGELFSLTRVDTLSSARHVNVMHPEEVVRLHVVAHSDNPQDQALKNALAHEIRTMLYQPLDSDGSKNEVLVHLENSLEHIGVFSRQFLSQQGTYNDVSVSLSSRPFPTREYAGTLLPAGEYQSLYITIGSGQGENWWCLLFPPMCFHVFPVTDASENNKTDLEPGGKKEQDAEKNSAPKIRFWFLEKLFNMETGFWCSHPAPVALQAG